MAAPTRQGVRRSGRGLIVRYDSPVLVRPHHQALVFDCDGTLADTMPAHYVAWIATLRRFALDHLLPHERFMAMGGVPATQLLRLLAAEGGVEMDAPAVAIEKEAEYLRVATDIRPIERVLAIARSYRGRLPLAVATGGHRNVVEHTLSAIGVLDWFDAIVTADDVTHPKPAPEPFLRCAELMRVDPTRCLAFEDADPGIEAARAAGMDVVDVRVMREGAEGAR